MCIHLCNVNKISLQTQSRNCRVPEAETVIAEPDVSRPQDCSSASVVQWRMTSLLVEQDLGTLTWLTRQTQRYPSKHLLAEVFELVSCSETLSKFQLRGPDNQASGLHCRLQEEHCACELLTPLGSPASD